MPRPDSVAVVGGGAVGTTLAGDLQTRGVDVTLFERDAIASGASGRAAGLCYDAYADRRDARIAGRALERFRDLPVDFEACPYVLLAREDDQAAAVTDLCERMVARGLDVEEYGPDRLGADFPGLDTTGVETALVAHNAGLLDAEAYTEAMATRAREAGASVHTDTPATLSGHRTVDARGRTRRFDAVVITAGPATKALLGTVGVEIPLSWYRTQALVTDPLSVGRLPSLFDASEECYLRPWGDGVLLGDGVETGVDPETYDSSADADFLATGRDHLRRLLGVDATVDRAWAGLCTATPDRDPLVGPVAEGLYVATGFHGHGLLRAPAIAEALAGQVCGGDGITGFDPDRFDGGESVAVDSGL